MTRYWLFELAAELTERLGFTLTMDPFLGEMARVRFADGSVCYLSHEAYDLNMGVSSELAGMPAQSLQFMAAAGLPVPEFGWVALGPEAAAQAVHVAERLGYPVILRSSGRKGVGPFLATDPAILADLIPAILDLAPAVVIQRPIWGLQTTVVVYRGEVRFAFERHPWRVVGDGRRSVQQLLEAHRAQNPALGLMLDDWRIDDMLEFGRRGRSTVPQAGEVVPVALKASLAHGGRVRALAGELDPTLASLAREAARQSGLSFCAIDLITNREGTWLLDVQPAPDLEPYMALGAAARRNVRHLVERLLLDTQASCGPTAPIAQARGS